LVAAEVSPLEPDEPVVVEDVDPLVEEDVVLFDCWQPAAATSAIASSQRICCLMEKLLVRWREPGTTCGSAERSHITADPSSLRDRAKEARPRTETRRVQWWRASRTSASVVRGIESRVPASAPALRASHSASSSERPCRSRAIARLL